MTKKLEDLTEAEALAELEKMLEAATRDADLLSLKLAKEREEYKKDAAPDTLWIIERTEKRFAATRDRVLVLTFCAHKLASARLEELRVQIEAENISYSEIAELQSLAAYIEPGDVQLLEWAGVPE